MNQPPPRRFGTFEGVFTPTILTILGAIMYLRLGWVVGNAGLGGALVIILMAKLVTITTGLAIASMSSNIKIGAGGSYAIISRSMGLEIGGAIGIPLYLSQALGAALYITGFTEAWVSAFPGHDPLWVASGVLIALLTLSFISAKAAMKLQYAIMFLIAFSLFSFFLAKGDAAEQITIWGDFEKAPFWSVFAIFFPAVTGIEAGAAMSGDLKDPKRSLSVGILSSIAVSFVVYVALVFWMDRTVSPDLLKNNYTVMIEVSRWRWVMIAAVFGATLSSALGSIVGGPRTLMALGQHKVVPFGSVLARLSKQSEPRFSILVTGVIIEVSLIFGELNTIAPLLTMFFLITYGTINLAVFIEKRIGIASYRPSFDVPLVFPLVGALWSFIAMFLINAVFAAVALLVIVLVYIWQVRLGHQAPWGDVRAGLFTAVAEWAVRMASLMPHSAKTWKPNLMIPVEDPQYWKMRMDFVRDIAFPRGSVRVLSVKVVHYTVRERINELVSQVFQRVQPVAEAPSPEQLEDELAKLIQPLKDEGLLAAATVIEANHFLEGVSIVTQALRGMPLPPNVMFLSMSNDPEKSEGLEELISIAVREQLGIIVLKRHAEKGFGDRKTVNLWLRSGSPNRNLTLLTALQLERNWNGHLRLIRVVDDASEANKAEVGLRQIIQRGRLPLDVQRRVLVGPFLKLLEGSPEADINIFGMSAELDVDDMRKVSDVADTASLFIKDSGQESALA